MRQVRSCVLAALIGMGMPGGAQAQEIWVSGWLGGFMNPGTVDDPESGTRWDFGTSVLFGAGVHTRVGQGLTAGLDVGYSPARHEVLDAGTGARLAEGRAHVVTFMAAGRLGALRGAGFGTYLSGGVGTMIYGIPHLDRWDPDLALRAGGGVEYAPSRTLNAFLEWHRWWVFHQGEGVRDNVANHGTLELGVRLRP